MNFLGSRESFQSWGGALQQLGFGGILQEGGCLRVDRRKHMSSGGIQSRSGWKREQAMGLLPPRAILPQEATKVYL